MSKRVLIIDGDLLIFRNVAGFEKRSINVTHIRSGRTKVFKNKTEFLKFLKESGKEYNELDYLIEDIQEAVHPRLAVNSIEKAIKLMMDETWADTYEMYVGNDETTFRKKLPLPTPYKDNRDNLIKPVHLQEVKHQSIRKFKASTFEGLETDDVVTIRCYEELAKGNYPILATFDKDAMQTQGVCILQWTKTEKSERMIEIPRVGTLRKNSSGNTYTGTGLRFLAYQALAGDPTDTYQPYQLSKVRYGPSTAAKALETPVNATEIFEVIEQEYQKLYPETITYTDCHGDNQEASWQDMLSIYWKCAYMKRSWDDPSDYWKFKDEQKAKD